jgi:GNAT superfamily N-acetyltransferase
VSTSRTDEVSLDPELDRQLDNAVWHALTTHHAAQAQGRGRARRYDPDYSPFCAVESLDGSIDAQGWADLAALTHPGGAVLLFRPAVPEGPPEWNTALRAEGHQMVLDVRPDDVTRLASAAATLPVRPLTVDDVPAMAALVAETQPGPFRDRTIDLGSYVGVHDEGRLVAMAGERFRWPGATEVSAVCTHPDAQGRGLAAALTMLVASGIAARGDLPFLHVASTNDGARRVYERIGFRTRRLVDVRVLITPTEEVDRA